MSISDTAVTGSRRGRAFRNLPLFWKLLIPFLALLVFIGGFGVLVTARDLSSRARAALDRDLARLSLEVRSSIRDRELYLVESVNFATNVQGLAEAISRGDRVSVTRLASSVLALKPDLDVLIVLDGKARGIVEFRGREEQRNVGAAWQRNTAVSDAMRTQRKASGFAEIAGNTVLTIAGPVCSAERTCATVGVVVASISLRGLAATAETAALGEGAAYRGRVGVSVFDATGRRIAAEGQAPLSVAPPSEAASRSQRAYATEGGEALATLFVPFELQGRRVGSLGVSLPTAPALAAVRGAALRQGGVVLAAMIGIVAIGALLSRLILAQVRPLVATNRALEQGDLGARVPVMGRDELGELASGVNRMAERLQASHETLETRVAERTEEVQRLLQERTQFFAGLSHELRTPLAAIVAQADLILDRTYPLAGKTRREVGGAVMASAEQLLRVVNEILDVARSEAGTIEVHTEEFKLPDFVRGIRGIVEGLARGGAHRLVVDVPRRLPAVRADPTRLRQIVLNLVENAVKYTPQGGKIKIIAAARNGAVEVSVADTGVGIPADAKDRVFEPFFRAEGVRTQGGQAASGLGLALTKRLVEAQGGAIRFESEPGAGSVFTFTLERARAGAARKRA